MRTYTPTKWFLVTSFILSFLNAVSVAEMPIYHIKSAIENGSPCSWEIDGQGNVVVHLLADKQRCSANRQTTHWYFQIQAKPGSEFTLIINKPYDIYNGHKVLKIPQTITSSISSDGKTWRVIQGKGLTPSMVQYNIKMTGEYLYFARIQPYTLSDLQVLLNRIKDCDYVTVSTIGKTVEGRPLEIIQVGNSAAPNSVLLRARCHPWESGGNWVVQGLLDRMCQADETIQKYLKRYCLYIMPMANKDVVVRGMTRFNMNGCDLNRNWEERADPDLAPENDCLEQWLTHLIQQGHRPGLAIDYHNDEDGRIHFCNPDFLPESSKQKIESFEKILKEYTWFSEGSSLSYSPGTFDVGMGKRYQILGITHELHANIIKSLGEAPLGRHWEELGRQLPEVFYRFFEDQN